MSDHSRVTQQVAGVQPDNRMALHLGIEHAAARLTPRSRRR